MAGTDRRSCSAPSRVDADQADALARVAAAEPAGVAGAAGDDRPDGDALARRERQAGSRARRPRRSPRTRVPGCAGRARRRAPIPCCRGSSGSRSRRARPSRAARRRSPGSAGPGSGTSTTSIVDLARVTAARMPTRSRARSSSPSLAVRRYYARARGGCTSTGRKSCNSMSYSCSVARKLADVAKQAGVSEATVSRVLNGKPGHLRRDARGGADCARRDRLRAADQSARAAGAAWSGWSCPSCRTRSSRRSPRWSAARSRSAGSTPVLCTRTRQHVRGRVRRDAARAAGVGHGLRRRPVRRGATRRTSTTRGC